MKETIEKICVIHFGIRSGLLDELLIESVISTIISKFKTLTTRDLMSSFERIEIKKDGWKNITKRDLIDPIQNWWNKKEEIRIEFEKYQSELAEIEQAESKIEEFKNVSIDVYRKSIVCGEWQGDIFHANAIARDIAIGIPKHIKNELWAEAKRKKYIQDKAFKEDPKSELFMNTGITAERIFSELVVIQGIKQRIKL